MLSIELQNELLKLARKTIKDGCEKNTKPEINVKNWSDQLQEHRATFVTLHKNNDLRGCIGSLEAYRPLVEDVAMNSYASAFYDSRFSPVTAEEINNIIIDISVLTPKKALDVSSEKELLQKIRPNIDGLIIESSIYRATFLPSVWEELSDPELFLSQLKIKAGMPLSIWPEDMQCYVYQTEMIKEKLNKS